MSCIWYRELWVVRAFPTYVTVGGVGIFWDRKQKKIKPFGGKHIDQLGLVSLTLTEMSKYISLIGSLNYGFKFRKVRVAQLVRILLQCRKPPATQDTADPWVRRIPGEGDGYPLQHSYPRNPMDKRSFVGYTFHGAARVKMTEWWNHHKDMRKINIR